MQNSLPLSLARPPVAAFHRPRSRRRQSALVSDRRKSTPTDIGGYTLSLAVAGLLLLTPHLRAATIVKANNDDALNLNTSWVGGTTPTVDDIAQFDNTLTAARFPDLGANTNWLGIKLNNPNGAVTITNLSFSTLTLLSSGIDMSSATKDLTVLCGLKLGAGQSWNVASDRTLDASTVALGRSLKGTVDFSTNGTIKIGNAHVNGIVGSWATCGGDDWATGAGGGAVSALSAGSYTAALTSGNNTSTNASPSPGSFTTGTLKLTTNFDWTANSGDVIILDRGGILIPTGVSNYLSASTGTISLRGPADGELIFQGGGTLQLASSAIIANNTSASSLTKSGSGTLVLNGANSYTGGTTLNSGTLKVGNAGSIGSGTFTINGGTLDTTGTGTVAMNNTGAGTINGDINFIGTGNLALSASMNTTLTRDIRITVQAHTLTTPRQMFGAYGFTKDGAGTFQMNRLNDISGVVHMLAGTLFFNNSTGEGSGSQIGYNLVNARLDMQGGTLIFTSAATNHCIAGLMGSGTIDFSQSAGNIILAITPSDRTYSGSLIGANGGIMITAPGVYDGGGNVIGGASAKQTFTGPNTYGGNTVLCLDNAFGATATNCVLALSGNGSISNSASIVMGAIGTNKFYNYQMLPYYTTELGGSGPIVDLFGAVFDVSGVTGGIYTLDGSVSQSLVGNGTVKGKLVVPSGSSVSPGLVTFLNSDGLGALTFTVGPKLASGSTLNMKLKKSGATLLSDTITVAGGSGALSYGGTLSVSIVAGSDGLADGDQFTLFSADHYAGAFDTLSLPDVSGAGLQWNTSLLYLNGSIKVEPAGTADPVTSFSIGKSGGNFNFNYAGGVGSQFVLIRSFNLSAPLNTWTPLKTNLTTPGAFSIPIGTNPAAFYRVRTH
jgi:autotransporter-associated beta strand protein